MQGSKSLNLLLGMAALVVIVAGMKAAASLVVPFLIAAFLAVLCTPALSWLQEKGCPTAVALLLVIVAASAVFMSVVGVAGASINDFAQNIDRYGEALGERKDRVVAWLEERDVTALDSVLEGNTLQESFDPKKLIPYVTGVLASVGGVLSNTFLVLLTLIFILLEAAGLPKKIAMISGGADWAGEIGAAVRNYVAIKTWLSLATAVLLGLWLWWLGVEYWILWALLAFFFNFVPNIGSIIAAVPPVLLAIVQPDGSLSKALAVAIGYAVVNIVIGNAIEPRVMGRGLGLSTLVVFVSLVFWGWVLGPVGMVLSVPLTMITKIVLEGSEETRPLAILLGSDSQTPPK